MRLVRRSLMVLNVHLSVRLSELVQNRSGTLSIDCRNLSHNLAIVGVGVISKLLVLSLGCLVGADLGRTSASVGVIVATSLVW